MIGIFLLLLGGEGVFAYYCIKDRNQANQNLVTLDKQLKEAEAKEKLKPLLTEKLAELNNIFEEYVAILPREEEVGTDKFLEDIDRFTKDTGLNIKSAKPVVLKKKKVGKKGKGSGRKKLNFLRHKYRFELEGTFFGLVKFITAIENHSRFLQVDSIELRPVNSKQGGQKSDVELAENPRKYLMVEISTYTYSKETKAEEAK